MKKKASKGGWSSETLKPGAKTKIMPIKVDDRLHRRIRAKAQKQGLSVSEFVRRATIEAMKRGLRDEDNL